METGRGVSICYERWPAFHQQGASLWSGQWLFAHDEKFLNCLSTLNQKLEDLFFFLLPLPVPTFSSGEKGERREKNETKERKAGTASFNSSQTETQFFILL